MGWVFGGGDSTEYGRGTREFAVVQKPTGLLSIVMASSIIGNVASIGDDP